MAKGIEFLKPIRSEYASDEEYIYACGVAVAEYNKAIVRAIDRSIGSNFAPQAGTRDKLTARQREQRDSKSLHDYLEDKPQLRERYKKLGAAALLEI